MGKALSKNDQNDGKTTRVSIDTKKEGEVEEEEIIPDDVVLTSHEINVIVDDDDDDDNDDDKTKDTKDIANYCLSLLRADFCGQTSVAAKGHVRVFV